MSTAPKRMELFKRTEALPQKNAPLNVSLDINERMQLKRWAKDYKTTMAKIIKKALSEFYLRYDMDRQQMLDRRAEKQKARKHSKEAKVLNKNEDK